MYKGKLKILIADDEPLMRGLLTSYLSKECHHDILKAQDGKEALSLYRKYAKAIDITFLDIEMPKLNGLEVLSAIREVNPDAYVVILSGASNIENVKTAIAAGVNGFIAKPYTNNKIAEALKNFTGEEDSPLLGHG